MPDPTIPALFATERAARGIDQREFARSLGLRNHQVIDQWEGGARPSSDTLFYILLRAPEQWARKLALRSLNLRYPNVIIRPRPE